MHWLVMLLRLPWWTYLLAAPLFVAGAGYALMTSDRAEAANAAALRARPPASIAVESFDPTRHVNRVGEVAVVGQLDLARTMQLTQTRGVTTTHQWTLIPIYAATATDTKSSPPAVLIQEGGLTDAQIARMRTGTGKFGPILTIDGLFTTDDDAVAANRSAFKSRGPDTSRAALIDPFENGRADGLKPDDDSHDLAVGLGAFAVMSMVYALFRRAMTRPKPATI